MDIVTAVWGFVILLVGRQYYASFVAAIFFVASAYLIERFWGTPQGIQAIWVPLLFALLGWGLTMEMRRWIARPAIFLAGVYIFMELPLIVGAQAPLHWAFFALGGAIAFVFSLVWFDYTLVVLSMLTGATMILGAAGVRGGLGVAYVALTAIFSLGAQFVIMRSGPPAPD